MRRILPLFALVVAALVTAACSSPSPEVAPSGTVRAIHAHHASMHAGGMRFGGD